MASTPSQSATPNEPPTWRFIEQLEVTTHGTHQCTECPAWVKHYVEALTTGDASLLKAKKAKKHYFRSSSGEAEHFHKDLIATRNENVALQIDLDNARRDFHSKSQQLDEANRDLEGVNNQLDDTHKTIKRLRDDLAHYEQGNCHRHSGPASLYAGGLG